MSHIVNCRYLILFTFIYLLSYLPLHTFCQTAKHSLPFSVLFCWGGGYKVQTLLGLKPD